MGTHNSFPPSPSLLVLVLLLGAVAATGELFVLFALGHLRAIAALDAVMGAFDPVEAASTPDQDRAEIKSPARERAASETDRDERRRSPRRKLEDPSLEGANDSGGNGAARQEGAGARPDIEGGAQEQLAFGPPLSGLLIGDGLAGSCHVRRFAGRRSTGRRPTRPATVTRGRGRGRRRRRCSWSGRAVAIPARARRAARRAFGETRTPSPLRESWASSRSSSRCVHPRAALIGTVFVLVAYLPDVVGGGAHKLASAALPLMLVTAVVVRHVSGVERVAIPSDVKWFAGFGVALLLATATAGHRTLSELSDFTGFALLAAVMLILVDSRAWLRRVMWAIVAGAGMLAAVSVVQQLTRSYGHTFGGLAVDHARPDRHAQWRPAQPRLLRAGARRHGRARRLRLRSARVRGSSGGSRAAAAAVSLLGAFYTQSRGALVAVVVAAIVLRGPAGRAAVEARRWRGGRRGRGRAPASVGDAAPDR